jgi:hypothetical protein
MRFTPSNRYSAAQGAGGRLPPDCQSQPKDPYRQIADQLLGKRKILFNATDHEVTHGRDIAWSLRPKEAPEHIKETPDQHQSSARPGRSTIELTR